MTTQLFNLILRAFTLISKFILLFYLAKYLSPMDFGSYGLFVVSVFFSIYLVGLDFYTFSNRSLLYKPIQQWGRYIKTHAFFVSILYIIFLPLFLLIFYKGFLPWQLSYYFFAILVLEHLNQEVMRLLISLARPTSAAIVLFIRSGLWGIILILMIYFNLIPTNLTSVLIFWIVGNIIALIISIKILSFYNIGDWGDKIDFTWLKNGLKICLPFLIATLTVRLITTIDRYWLEYLAGLDIVGAYTFFMGMASALIAFMDAGVFAFIYPKLITAVRDKNFQEYKKNFHNLILQTLLLGFVFIICATLSINYILDWLGKDLYTGNKEIFYWLLAANFIYCLSMIPHYGLYALGYDKPIIQSHLLGLLIFVVSTLFFSQLNIIISIPVGVFIAFSSIFISKLYFYFIFKTKNITFNLV